MLRFLVVSVFVVGALAQPAGDREYASKLMKFHEAYNTFFRDYFGCPKRAIDTSECDPAKGVINYGAYLKASKAVREAFPEGK